MHFAMLIGNSILSTNDLKAKYNENMKLFLMHLLKRQGNVLCPLHLLQRFLPINDIAGQQ